ncbi:hypothetical protein FE257_008451 [Aspergillus nanangensis]|uniref:RING-type domain-containing protein n=1 Tax=Aspergillus nanangensis TaxID=2582783 RepID=A0AAD4CMX3_ASPNN|nr:hypothetical protein FE257_008451 [Aspergillus nanangensis]
MSTYEVEHGTTDPSRPSQNSRPRRPDLSTFFTALSDISPDEARSRPHAVPVPRDISGAHMLLAEAFQTIARDSDSDSNVLTEMIQTLLTAADTPPKDVEGVTEEFCDVLDRVPRSALKPDQTCPICSNVFLDDQYPLVVRLPCHPTHLFDMECVRPWLRLRGTCPLDRRDFAKEEREKAEARKKKPVEDDEEEWDGMYA